MTDQSYTPGPLLDCARTTQTALWNDSSDLDELKQSISFGGVGATCNPVIAYTTIKQHLDVWKPRIEQIAADNPTWGESQIGWQAVKDMSVEAAALLKPIFDEQKGRNGRLSVQTDPRFHRDAKALADQAVEFHELADNVVVKSPATKTGLEAIEDATYRGVTINVTVSFTVPQAMRAAEAIERGLQRREAEARHQPDVARGDHHGRPPRRLAEVGGRPGQDVHRPVRPRVGWCRLRQACVPDLPGARFPLTRAVRSVPQHPPLV